MVKEKKKLCVKTRRQWRTWLEKNHNIEKEIWLVYYKKHTGKKGIPYDDAVEEALCFGWIDSTVNKLDEERYIQRYTPRNDSSIWAITNIRRAKRMIKEGKMTEAGMKKFRLSTKRKENIIPKRFAMPQDFRKALSRNKTALKNFKNLAASYRKMYIWWIISAKRDETKRRRIKKAVERLEQNKKYAM